MKNIDQRLKEAVNVHARLEKLGILVTPDNRTMLRDASNKFVKDGVPSTLTFNLSDKPCNVRVVFTPNEKVYSGVFIE